MIKNGQIKIMEVIFMKSKFTKYLFSFTMVFILLFSACNKTKNSTDKSTKSDTSNRPSTSDSTEDIMQIPTKTSATQTEKPVIATTVKSSQKPVTSREIKQNFTLSEIVDIYNTAVNNVKPRAKTTVRNNQKLVALQPIPAKLPFAGELSKQFDKGTCNTPFVCNNRELIKKHFIIYNKSYSSKMTHDIVEWASCNYKDGKYYIKIKIKDDPKDTQKYSSKCLPVLTPKDISSYANTSLVKEKNIKTTCKNCIIEAVIDEKSGNMQSLNYKMPTYISAKILGVNYDFSFCFEQDWSIFW